VFPDDRILIGVINRKKDLKTLHTQNWYRIPVARMKHFIDVEYIAFFLSTRVAPGKVGGVYYHAAVTGHELKRRIDLLPDEPDHKNAHQRYYQVTLQPLTLRHQPILNPDKRVISFIYTTGDRYLAANTIIDLYSDADQFVERVYHRLQAANLKTERIWSLDADADFAPGLRVMYTPSTQNQDADYHEIKLDLRADQDEDAILAMIEAELALVDGPVMINLPYV
jgi:hypothetical protein